MEMGFASTGNENLEISDDLARLGPGLMKPQDQSNATTNKRRRDESDDGTRENCAIPLEHFEAQNVDTVTSGSSEPKRSRHAVPALQPQYTTLHRVVCSTTATHSHHQPEGYFLDTPRLFAGDSKVDSLRGEDDIVSVQQYLENHPEISFVIFKQYSCDAYHETIRQDFEPLTMPRFDQNLTLQLKLYFFVLKGDGEKAIPDSEFVMIVSNDLRRVISSLLPSDDLHFDLDSSSFVDGRPINFDFPTSLRWPYTRFYPLRPRMTEWVAKPNANLSSIEREHLSLFFEYMMESCGDNWVAADALFQEGMVNRTHFHKLFEPGEVLVTRSDTQQRAYHLTTCLDGDEDSLELYCKSWVFDETFRKKDTTQTVNFPSEDDLIEITSLEIFPLRYDNSGLEEKLRQRGQQFWACRKRAFVGYESPVPALKIQTATLRYMVDNAMYRQMHPVETETPSQEDYLDIEAMSANEPPANPFLLLLPATIRGFGLHNKKWEVLSVEHIRPVNWNHNAFENHLVLKAQKKDLIKALISVHIGGTNSITTDIIEGKGKGLIILLHGGPGTGKTLTAESVAELAERPLYRVTCGDIGTDPEAVERYLDSVLYIGTVWGCVILLDEADIFLEARTQSDLKRNALVSVFLRVLEYYEGILILTTNRVGAFDEAFKSRIQLALHYPPLGKSERSDIWMNFINRLKYEGEKVNTEALKDKIDVLAKHKLNGRQIRNTINTARQLAKYRGEVMNYTHLDQAIDVANDFEEYVRNTHGHSDEEYARDQGMRF